MPVSPGEHAWTGAGLDGKVDPSDVSSPVSVQAFVTTTGQSGDSDISLAEFKDLRDLPSNESVKIRESHQLPTEGNAAGTEGARAPALEFGVQEHKAAHSNYSPDNNEIKDIVGQHSAAFTPYDQATAELLSGVKSYPAFKSGSKLRRSLTPDLARPLAHKRQGSLDSLLLPPNFTQSQVDSALHRRKSHLNPSVNRSPSPSITDTEMRPARLTRSSSLETVTRRPDTGFARAELGSKPLVGSVKMYDRMVFLCYKDPSSWPPRIEAAEADRLPKRLASAIYMKRKVFSHKTKFALCEGHDGNECDVLIFPDMKRFSAVTHFDIDVLIEEALLTGKEKVMRSQPITGCHVFICAHASRDARCGTCGPPLVATFQAVAKAKGLEDWVHVRACSHIGGHAYAGNVVIYMEREGKVTGDWYGYVTPRDVPLIVEQHIKGGRIVDHLWRGAMGLTAEEQQAELSRIRSCQDSDGRLDPEDAKCRDCSFLGGEEIEDLLASGVCAPQDPANFTKVTGARSCCPSSGSQDATNWASLKSFLTRDDNNSVFASVKAQIKRLQHQVIPEWVNRFDASDVALCGALAVSGAALYIAIDLHRRSR